MKPTQPVDAHGEIAAVRQRYSRRLALVNDDRYSILNPATWKLIHERQRAILRLLVARGRLSLDQLNLVEVGCGGGGNLLELLRFGFSPRRMVGIELLAERVAQAREVLPSALELHEGDALQVSLPVGSQDIVCQLVVFSSLLNENFQQQLANKMWSWVKPGGAVLWYDFVYNNPSNLDVRGVPLRSIKKLFPEGRIYMTRLTLAPPIARRVCGLHPALYDVFNCVPWLRTHVLCWIEKS